MKSLNLLFSLLLTVLLSYSSAFGQLEDLELQVIDFETIPAFEKSITDILTLGDQIFMTTEGGNFDLLVYDGTELKEIIKDNDEELAFLGPLSDGILMVIGSTPASKHLFFLDATDYELTQLHSFEYYDSQAVSFFDDKAIVLDYGARHLYATDGTLEGTVMLQEFATIGQNENLSFKFNGAVLFNADNKLWRTDGTLAGTFSFSDQAFNIIDVPFTESGGLVYYTVNNRELRVTDGTASGTRTISDDTPFTLTRITYAEKTDAGIVFIGQTDEHGYELWGANGAPDGTQLLADIVPGPEDGIDPYPFNKSISIGNQFMIKGEEIDSNRIWLSDGTIDGTQVIMDFAGQSAYNDFRISGPYSTQDGKVFFMTKNDIDDAILWRYDEVTQSVVQIVTMFNVTSSVKVYPAHSKVYFRYHDGEKRLWVTDGTFDGTTQLTTTESSIKFLGTHGDLFYYGLHNNGGTLHHHELYMSDGTIDGTGLLKDINSRGGSQPDFLFMFNDKVHFYATDDTAGQAIYSTDGTESGTEIVFDMYPNTLGTNNIEALTSAIGKLFFTIDDSLWVSDGTREGSYPLNFSYSSNPIIKLGEINGRLIFGDGGSGLWATDGTVEGTQRLVESNVLFHDNYPLARMDDFLWFFYSDLENGMELYKTDGTLSGTTMAFESSTGSESIFSSWYTGEIRAINGKLYFANETTEHGAELWQSDGTLEGTTLFMDIWPGTSSSEPNRFVSLQDNLYFNVQISGVQTLWKTDGTIEGTLELSETQISSQPSPVSIQDTLIFSSPTGQLWRTDGTMEGTKMIYEFNFNTFYNGIVAYDKHVFFNGFSQEELFEPWISDGTSTGTMTLRNIGGDDSSDPRDFTIAGDMLFFAAKDTVGTFQTLYRTDGTSHGTYKATNLGYDDLHGTQNLTFNKGKLYFLADNNTFGSEIYYYDLNIREQVSGEVFHDVNSNGVKDVDEAPVVNFPVGAYGEEEIFAYTNEEGKYSFFINKGGYDIAPILGDCWAVSSDSLSYTIQVADTVITNLDFGLVQVSGALDVWTKTTSAPTRCGFTVPFWVDVVNTGCDSISGEIQVEIDPLTELVGISPAPISTEENVYTWRFTDLAPTHRSKIELALVMPDEQFIGESIFIRSNIYLLEDNGLVWADSNLYLSEINCAYDPNDKLVEPNRSNLSPENYTLFEEQLTYTIRFQNTGTDTAFTVRIEDKISPLLDLSTFRPLTASHPFSTTVYPDRTVVFLFEDILLPDSTVNERASHGYVTFQINTLDELDEFAGLANTASIYFDFNAPIITNTTTNTLVSTFDFDQDGYLIWEDCDDNNDAINPGAVDIPDNGIDEDCDGTLLTHVVDIGDLSVGLFPNPTFKELNVVLQQPYDLEVSIIDPQGRSLLVQSIGDTARMDVSNLPAGIYFVKITDLNRPTCFAVQRLVKLSR